MTSPTPEQRQQIATWAAEGANLNQIQDRLRSEFGLSLTYMEARLLILELDVKIQEKAREKPPEEQPQPVLPPGAAEGDLQTGAPAPASSLRVTADEIPLEGASISGRATFSDGTSAVWFMDQMGRFGLRGPAPGYQPPAADIPAFQAELDHLLSLRGF